MHHRNAVADIEVALEVNSRTTKASPIILLADLPTGQIAGISLTLSLPLVLAQAKTYADQRHKVKFAMEKHNIGPLSTPNAP